MVNQLPRSRRDFIYMIIDGLAPYKSRHHPDSERDMPRMSKCESGCP